MKLSIPLIALGVLTGVVIGSAQLYRHIQAKNKHQTHDWQQLYYDNITQDDIAWG